MSTCQKCGENTLISLEGHSKDLSYTSVPSMDFEHDGYFPYIKGLCGGDDISITLCFSCGQVQGSWPKITLVEEAIRELRDEYDDDDEEMVQERKEREFAISERDELMDRLCYLNTYLIDVARVLENESAEDDFDVSYMLSEIQDWLVAENIHPQFDMNFGAIGAIIFDNYDQKDKFVQKWMPLVR